MGVSRGHSVKQVGREGRDAALARQIVTDERDLFNHKRLPQDIAREIEANFLYPGCNSLGSPNLLTHLVKTAQDNPMRGRLHSKFRVSDSEQTRLPKAE